MIHDALIGPLQDGEYFVGIVIWVLFLFRGIVYVIDEYQWSQVKPFGQECTLLNQNYKSSTLQTHSVPVATGNGIGMGMVTTGEDEKYITVWDFCFCILCGKYGRLVADDKEIFRLAKDTSTLLIKEKDGEYRIDGIVN